MTAQPQPAPGTENPFATFWQLGYRRLVPIIPPAAPISERSTLHRMLGTDADPRGKAVGVRGRDGLWRGLDWIHYEADEEDLQRWHAMGAGTGIKTGEGLSAIDADTMNERVAETIRDIIEERLGRLTVRVGRYPKALYVARVTDPFRYTRVEFDGGAAKPERVEVLSDGRQFVAHGTHPVTGKPYFWPRQPVPFDDIPLYEPDQITDVLEAIRSALPAASKLIREGASTEVDQSALRGDLDTVREAVAATPNTSEHFPSRESYRDFGYAIKASLPDHEPEALEIFQDWCARWQPDEGEGNDPRQVEADWRRMKPPFRRGARFLFETAEKLNPGQFQIAKTWFTPIPDNDNPFANQNTLGPFEDADDVYEVFDADGITSRPPPKFLIDRHIPEKSLGFLYAEPGVGKSFLALDMALHIAHGRQDWHGATISADPAAHVLYLASEGSAGYRNRILAWWKRHNVTDRTSGFRLIERTINFMSSGDVDKLIRTVRKAIGAAPCLIVVDTVSRAIPGADENLQAPMTLFVQACDRLKDTFACAVLGVHHVSKSGEIRGSTVLPGAGDFLLRLERDAGAPIGRLHCDKQKDGESGWDDAYAFERVELGDGQSSLVPERRALNVGPSIALTPQVAVGVLEALGAAWEAGKPWSADYRAGQRWAVKRMVQDHGFTMDNAKDVLSVWMGSGLVKEAEYDSRSGRVGLQRMAEVSRSGDVFS